MGQLWGLAYVVSFPITCCVDAELDSLVEVLLCCFFVDNNDYDDDDDNDDDDMRMT